LRFPPRSGLRPSLRQANFQAISKRANFFCRPKGEREAAIFLPKSDYKFNQTKI